jgi:hypothetical protein
VGGCYIWSWLNVVGILLWVLLFGLSILAFRSATKSASEEDKKETFYGDWRVSANKK